MTKKELNEEIEFIHDNRTEKQLLRPLDVMQKTICAASNTYTNISLFMNDCINLYHDGLINEKMYNSSMNDLYLLALLHTSCEEDFK